MTPLGLHSPTVLSGQPPVNSSTELQLVVEDTLTSARRLWVRGRLVFPLQLAQESSQASKCVIQ